MKRPSAIVLCAATGIAGCLIVALMALSAPRLALAAWLVAVLTVTMIPSGALPLLLIWRLHRGGWGQIMRPFMEAAVATMPMTLALMLPVLLLADWVYPWAASSAAQPGAWMQYGSFVARGILYIALWCAFAFLSTQQSQYRDQPGSGALPSAGLIVYALTASFAGIDWVLSLQPQVYSSIFGLVFVSHQMLGAFAFLALVSLARKDRPARPIRGIGNMLIGGLMLWAYFEYMQYLIIWSGDLPGHTAFYIERTGDAWTDLVYVMAVLGGALPFVALLSSRVRESAPLLAGLAAWFLAVRFMEAAWWVLPMFASVIAGMALSLAALFGAGGLWVGLWLFVLARRSASSEGAGAQKVAHG